MCPFCPLKRPKTSIIPYIADTIAPNKDPSIPPLCPNYPPIKGITPNPTNQLTLGPTLNYASKHNMQIHISLSTTPYTSSKSLKMLRKYHCYPNERDTSPSKKQECCLSCAVSKLATKPTTTRNPITNTPMKNKPIIILSKSQALFYHRWQGLDVLCVIVTPTKESTNTHSLVVSTSTHTLTLAVCLDDRVYFKH